MRRLPVCLLALAAGAAIAATLAPTGDTVVSMTLVDAKGQGAAIGEIVLSESRHGLVLTPRLKGLPPGLHGFHVHERPSCAPAEKDGAMVAGAGRRSALRPAGIGPPRAAVGRRSSW